VNSTQGGSGPLKGTAKYAKVNLTADDRYGGIRSHARLVCAAFHGPAPSDDHVVNHIDGNIRNVCVSLLVPNYVCLVTIVIVTLVY
jgi:hypothetical protein